MLTRRAPQPDRAERLRARTKRMATMARTVAARPTTATMGGTTAAPAPKECALQHQGYMAAVRDLGYCMLCRRACRPQFCHADQGKGERIKTDVRRGWPGCGPGPWGAGCHWLLGTSGQYEKQERRALEDDLARRTRAAVLADGTWPRRLPMWSEA